MPFAPSILAEFVHDYFPGFKPSPYMNVAYRVRAGAPVGDRCRSACRWNLSRARGVAADAPVLPSSSLSVS